MKIAIFSGALLIAAFPAFAAETEIKLKRLLGLPELKVKTRTAEEAAGIEGYFKNGYPSCALEVVEQFVEEVSTYDDSGKDNAMRFQAEVNDAMAAFECPWCLSDGRYFQIDAEFFHNEIVQMAKTCYGGRDLKGLTMNFWRLGKTSQTGKPKMSFSRRSRVSRVL